MTGTCTLPSEPTNQTDTDRAREQEMRHDT
jgi:hypothetical protein